MKIVEFGEDGKPKLLKPAEAPVAREVIAEDTRREDQDPRVRP